MVTHDEPTPRCALASCRAAFLPSQPGQRYCSRTHARTAEKQRQRERKMFGETVKELVSRQTAAYDTDPSQHWSDDPSQFSGYGDVPGNLNDEQGIQSGDSAPDPWAVQQALTDAIDAVQEDFDRKARLFIEQQRRNPGRMLPELAALQRQRDARIRELTREHYLADAHRQAERDRPGRIAIAHERAVEQAALNSFGGDLGRRYTPLVPDAGRDVHSAWRW